MPLEVTIPIRVTLLEEIPEDILICCVCKEQIFYRQHRLCFNSIPTNNVICSACKEANDA